MISSSLPSRFLPSILSSRTCKMANGSQSHGPRSKNIAGTITEALNNNDVNLLKYVTSRNEVAEEDPSICVDLRRIYLDLNLEGGKEDGSGTGGLLTKHPPDLYPVSAVSAQAGKQ